MQASSSTRFFLEATSSTKPAASLRLGPSAWQACSPSTLPAQRYIYSPAPCEQGQYSSEAWVSWKKALLAVRVMARSQAAAVVLSVCPRWTTFAVCGMGLQQKVSNRAAVVLRPPDSLRWNHIDALPFDRQWVEEFEKGLDWPKPQACKSSRKLPPWPSSLMHFLGSCKVRSACHACGVDSQLAGSAAESWLQLTRDANAQICAGAGAFWNHLKRRCLWILQGRQPAGASRRVRAVAPLECDGTSGRHCSEVAAAVR